MYDVHRHRLSKERENVAAIARMDNVMRDVDAFDDVIRWMHREFCAESVLCFIELAQWKQAMAAHVEMDDESARCDYVLNASVPRSTIVSRAEAVPSIPSELEMLQLAAIMRMRDAAHALYDKYVCVGAELEVNISGKLREQYKELERTHWNLDAHELAKVFDPLLKVMRQLMMQSFVRYENSVTTVHV